MFYLLCLCVVLAVMVVVLTLATLAAVPALGPMARLARRLSAGTAANLLFAFRAFPLVLSLVASLGLALPAFLAFEPHVTHENPGPALVILGGLGLLVTLAVLLRCVRMLWTTLTLERKWLKNAEPLTSGHNGVPAFCVNHSGSLVAVVGMFKPRIFVSRTVAGALSAEELDAALAHEMAHVRTGDNFRHFLLRLTRAPKIFPLLARIDSLWASTSEVAADERAIAYGASPLDLSSALVKVGRLSLDRPPELLGASHLVDSCASATLMRAERLRELLDGRTSLDSEKPGYRWLACGLAFLIVYMVALGTILPAIHESLELFVRY